MSTPRLTSARGSDFQSSAKQSDYRGGGGGSQPEATGKQRNEVELLSRSTTSFGSLSAVDSIHVSSSSLVGSLARDPSNASNLLRVNPPPATPILPSTLHRPPSSQMNRLPSMSSAANLTVSSGASSPSTSVPLHTLRSTNQFHMGSSESLHRTDGSDLYSHSCVSDSINDEDIPLHSSGRSLAANLSKTSSQHQQLYTRNLHEGSISPAVVLSESDGKASTPGSASNSINSYSQFISNASPRKPSESLMPPKSASSASTALRYQPTTPALHGNILFAKITTSDRNTSSNYSLTNKLSVSGSTRAMPSTSHKAVRGMYHISQSSSSGNMHSGGYFPVHSPDSSSLRSQDTLHHHRSTGGLNTSVSLASAQPSVINVWNRDVQANKSKGVRPSSSSSAQRPVTARANLLSMAGDDSTNSHLYSAAKTARSSCKERIPHSTHVPPRTAAVSSSGAQARARSAFVLRPPSRQRPPNQALHLGGGVGSPVTDRPISLQPNSMSQIDHIGSNSTRFNSKSGWGSLQLNPVVDLFPAAPVELVRAVKSAKRERTKNNAFGLAAPTGSSSVAYVSDYASSVSLGQGPHDDSASSDWDTEDTASIETDDGSTDRDVNVFVPIDGNNSSPIRSDDTAFGFSVAGNSSDDTNVLASPSSFVSLHNILQLQAEGGGYGSRGKSRQSSASSNRKLNAHLHRHVPASAESIVQRPPATAQPMANRPPIDVSVYRDFDDFDFAQPVSAESDQRRLTAHSRPVSRRVQKRTDSRSTVDRSDQLDEVQC